MPPSPATTEENNYNFLLDDVAGYQGKGRVMVLGDLNARVGSAIAPFDDPGSRLDYFLAAASRWVLPKRRRTGGAAAGCGRPRCVWVQVPPAATPMAPARLHAGIHRRRAAGLNADDDATP
ncbi:g5186 [Coccomyxa elongata]